MTFRTGSDLRRREKLHIQRPQKKVKLLSVAAAAHAHGQRQGGACAPDYADNGTKWTEAVSVDAPWLGEAIGQGGRH